LPEKAFSTTSAEFSPRSRVMRSAVPFSRKRVCPHRHLLGVQEDQAQGVAQEEVGLHPALPLVLDQKAVADGGLVVQEPVFRHQVGGPVHDGVAHGVFPAQVRLHPGLPGEHHVKAVAAISLQPVLPDPHPGAVLHIDGIHVARELAPFHRRLRAPVDQDPGGAAQAPGLQAPHLGLRGVLHPDRCGGPFHLHPFQKAPLAPLQVDGGVGLKEVLLLPGPTTSRPLTRIPGARRLRVCPLVPRRTAPSPSTTRPGVLRTRGPSTSPVSFRTGAARARLRRRGPIHPQGRAGGWDIRTSGRKVHLSRSRGLDSSL
jgi:hypothetical protein